MANRSKVIFLLWWWYKRAHQNVSLIAIYWLTLTILGDANSFPWMFSEREFNRFLRGFKSTEKQFTILNVSYPCVRRKRIVQSQEHYTKYKNGIHTYHKSKGLSLSFDSNSFYLNFFTSLQLDHFLSLFPGARTTRRIWRRRRSFVSMSAAVSEVESIVAGSTYKVLFITHTGSGQLILITQTNMFTADKFVCGRRGRRRHWPDSMDTRGFLSRPL